MPPQDENQIDISLALVGGDATLALNSLTAEMTALRTFFKEMRAESTESAVTLGRQTTEALAQTTTGTGTSSGASKAQSVHPNFVMGDDGTYRLSPNAQGGMASDLGALTSMPKASDVTSEDLLGGMRGILGDDHSGIRKDLSVLTGASVASQDSPDGNDEEDQPGLFKRGKNMVTNTLSRENLTDVTKNTLKQGLETGTIYSLLRDKQSQAGIGWSPQGIERIGTSYGMPQGQFPGPLGALNNLPFTIPGSQLLTSAGRTGLAEQLDTVWEGLTNRNISVKQLGEIKGGLIEGGYNQGEVRPLVDQITKRFGNKGPGLQSLGSPQTWVPLMDQAMRHGASSTNEMLDVIKDLPAAARSARMGVEEFNQQLNVVANELESKGALRNVEAQRAATNFSMATRQPPEMLSKLSDNPFISSQLMGQGFLPWEQGALPAATTLGTTEKTMDMLRQMLPVKDKSVKTPWGSKKISARDQQNQWLLHLMPELGSVENIEFMAKHRRQGDARLSLAEANDNFGKRIDSGKPFDDSRDASKGELRDLMRKSGFSRKDIDSILKKDPHKIDDAIRQKLRDLSINPKESRVSKDPNQVHVEVGMNRETARLFNTKVTDESQRKANKGRGSRVYDYTQGPVSSRAPYQPLHMGDNK